MWRRHETLSWRHVTEPPCCVFTCDAEAGCHNCVQAVFRLCSVYSSRAVCHAVVTGKWLTDFSEECGQWRIPVRMSGIAGLYIAALCTLPLYLTAGSPDWPTDLHRQVVQTPPKRLSQFTSRHIAAFNTTWLFINLWLTVYRADASSRPRLSHSVSSYLQLTFTPSQLVPVASMT